MEENASLTYEYNSQVFVSIPVPENAIVVPASGTIGHTKIYRQFTGGTQSVTEWDGELDVKAGDIILVDSLTGALEIKKSAPTKTKK